MKCPYCEKEMEEGFICNNQVSKTFWLPKKIFQNCVFLPCTKNKIKEKGGFSINNYSVIAKPDSIYVCKKCCKIIADIEI